MERKKRSSGVIESDAESDADPSESDAPSPGEDERPESDPESSTTSRSSAEEETSPGRRGRTLPPLLEPPGPFGREDPLSGACFFPQGRRPPRRGRAPEPDLGREAAASGRGSSERAPDPTGSRSTAVSVAALYTGLVAPYPFERLATRQVLFPGRVERVLQEAIPRGSQVFTCDWEFTGEMMLALPDRRFMVALDPVLFVRHDPELYRIWFETVRRPPPATASLIAERFGSRFVLCDNRVKWRPFIEALGADPRARPLVVAGSWILFGLTTAPPGAEKTSGTRPDPR